MTTTRAERVREAQYLRSLGLTLIQIGETLGVGRSTASSYLSDPDLSGREREYKEFDRLLEQDTILENLVLTGLRAAGSFPSSGSNGGASPVASSTICAARVFTSCGRLRERSGTVKL